MVTAKTYTLTKRYMKDLMQNKGDERVTTRIKTLQRVDNLQRHFDTKKKKSDL